MTDRQRLYINDAKERVAVIGILAGNGYSVRIGREHAGKTSRWIYFVEYWREDAS